MGAACVRPTADNEEIEYYGPPDRPRTVPTDLKRWKQALAEQKRQPQQPPQSDVATVASASSVSSATASVRKAEIPSRPQETLEQSSAVAVI